MTKRGDDYTRLWTPKKRAAFQAAWEAFGSARNTIYAHLFIDLRPGLFDVGEAKKRAVIEAGKRWEELTALPPLCTAAAWKATCKAVGIPAGTDIGAAESEITAWALALQAEKARDAARTQERWSKSDTPKRWAKRFGVSVSTIKRHFRDGSIPNRPLSDRSYQVRLDSVPQEPKP